MSRRSRLLPICMTEPSQVRVEAIKKSIQFKVIWVLFLQEVESLRQTSSSRGQLSRHRDADVESDPELELDGCLGTANLSTDWTLILTQRSPSKVERWPSNEIECSIDGHITTNIPFACYQLYGRNLQTKSSLSRCLEVMSTSKRNPYRDVWFLPPRLLVISLPTQQPEPRMPGIRHAIPSGSWGCWVQELGDEMPRTRSTRTRTPPGRCQRLDLFIKVISVLCYYLTAASNRKLVQTSGCKVHKTRLMFRGRNLSATLTSSLP